MPSRWAKLLLALVIAVGFLLRLTHLLETSRSPDFSNPQFESQYHDYWARSLVTGDWQPPAGVTDPEIRKRPYFRPPGYPWFLAAIYRVAGLGPFTPRIVHMLLGLASILLLYRLVLSLFGRTHVVSALAASAIAACSWILIFFESELMEPTLLSFIILLLVNLAIGSPRLESSTTEATEPQDETIREQMPAHLLTSIGAGILLAGAALIRPNTIVLVPILLIALWYRSRHFRPQRCLFFVAALIACIAPATLRNVVVSGQPILISCNAGINLFIGLHPETDGYTPGVAELGELTGLDGWDSFDWPKIVALVADRFELDPPSAELTADRQVARFFTQRAVRTALADPVGTASSLGRKALLFWGPDDISNNKILSMERLHSAALSRAIGFPIILAAAMLGIAILCGQLGSQNSPFGDRHSHVLGGTLVVCATVLALFASYLPFFASARFRAPLIPLLAVFGGYLVGSCVHWLEQRRWRVLLAMLATLAGTWILAMTPWVPYQEDRSTWHWRRALLHRQAGDRIQAMYELERTLELSPQRRDARLALADALAAGPSTEQRRAVSLYEQLLDRSSPESSGREPVDRLELVVLNNLATLLAGPIGDLDGAIDCWQRVLQREPDNLITHFNLAVAFTTRAQLGRDGAPQDLARASELVAAALQKADPPLQKALRELEQRINLHSNRPSSSEQR